MVALLLRTTLTCPLCIIKHFQELFLPFSQTHVIYNSDLFNVHKAAKGTPLGIKVQQRLYNTCLCSGYDDTDITAYIMMGSKKKWASLLSRKSSSILNTPTGDETAGHVSYRSSSLTGDCAVDGERVCWADETLWAETYSVASPQFLT